VRRIPEAEFTVAPPQDQGASGNQTVIPACLPTGIAGALQSEVEGFVTFLGKQKSKERK